MNEQKDPSVKGNTRETLLQELLKFLRRKNQPSTGWWEFLDRPIMVALFGTILLGLFTTFWADRQKDKESKVQYRRTLFAIKAELLGKISSAYQSGANILNGRLLRTVWLAEERNKPGGDQRQEKIKSWGEQLQKLEEEYAKAEAFDGLLTQTAALFPAPAQNTATTLKSKFIEFESFVQRTIQAYNAAEHLNAAQREEAENKRKTLVQEIDRLYQQLLQEIGVHLRNESGA